MAETTDSISYDESDTCWHIMTVTRGGTVSMLRNLDAPTARKAYQRLDPRSRPIRHVGWPKAGDPDFKHGFSFSSGFQICGDGDIKTVEVIGPEGAKLDPWRDVEETIIDMSAEVESQRARIRAHREGAVAVETKARRPGFFDRLKSVWQPI